MMKTEYAENGSADLLCKVLDRGNMHKAYKRVKVNKGAAGSGILTHTITNERLARRGYYDISEAYKSMHGV